MKKTNISTLSGFLPAERIAISLIFLASGLFFGSWTPKVPDIVDRLDLTPGMMGLMVLLFGVGSISLMPISAGFVARYGSAWTVRRSALIFMPTMLFLALAPNVWLTALACFLFGGLAGAMDIAMNANAVEVERSMKRAIMSSCHAFWSLGALFGSAIGGFLIDHYGTVSHSLIITIAGGIMILIAFPLVMPDTTLQPGEAKPKARLPRTVLPWLIGFIAMISMMPEGLVYDWSALYLTREHGTSLTVASLGGAAFSTSMAIMRFAGDLVRDRLGAVLTMRISTVLAAIGLLMTGLAPDANLTLVGFALAGMGVANMLPIAFSAGGNLPGMAPGVGLSVATTMGYSGALFAPTVIGFVAEHTGFAIIYAAFPLLFIVVLASSHHMIHADEIKGAGH